MKRLLCFLMIHEWVPTGCTFSGRTRYVKCKRCKHEGIVEIDSGACITNKKKVDECARRFGYEALDE